MCQNVLTQPENWVKRRDVSTRHVAACTTSQGMDCIVNVLQAAPVRSIFNTLTNFPTSPERVVAHGGKSLISL